MQYFRPGSQLRQLITMLSIVGEYPIRSLYLLGNERAYKALVHKLTTPETMFFIGYVPTSSMEPTLKTGSVLLGIRIIGSIETGDIIVFRHNEKLFVKRVAAVGGDMIEHDGQLVTVPVDCFYVLWDNTEHSYDSRCWKKPFVERQDVLAVVIIP